MASLGLSVNEHPQDGFRLLEALCASLDVESAAADRAITVSVLDAWLKSTVAIEDNQPISGLLNRVMDIGNQHWQTDANFHEYSGVDWLTRSINDWTGKSAQVWMKLPQTTPADDGPRRLAALEAMKHGLTRLLDRSEAPNRLAAAIIGNRVNWLFAVTPEWTVDTVLPLFDATKGFERAMSAWNGYLYSASADQQLLNAGLLEPLLDARAPTRQVTGHNQPSARRQVRLSARNKSTPCRSLTVPRHQPPAARLAGQIHQRDAKRMAYRLGTSTVIGAWRT